jgi:hypothetical protein
MAVALGALVLVLVAGDAAWRTTGLIIGALAYSVYLVCEVLGLWLAQAGPAAVGARVIQPPGSSRRRG